MSKEELKKLAELLVKLRDDKSISRFEHTNNHIHFLLEFVVDMYEPLKTD